MTYLGFYRPPIVVSFPEGPSPYTEEPHRTEHWRFLREMLGRDPAGPIPEAVLLERREFLAAITGTTEAEWDPAKHPRLGGAPNAGWFASTDGGGGANTGTDHVKNPGQAEAAKPASKPNRTREVIVKDLHDVNQALQKWKQAKQDTWFIGPSKEEQKALLERIRQLLDELEPHLSDHELTHVADWRDLQNTSKKIHDRLNNIFVTPSISADYRSPEELKAAAREARFHYLLSKNANKWWLMTNAERSELQSEITARAAAYRDRYHDEAGYSFFMRQLDKLLNPAWRGMGNMDDLLMQLGGAAMATRSQTPRLPFSTRPDIVTVRPGKAVPGQPLRLRPAPSKVGPDVPYNRAKHYGKTPTQADRYAVGAGQGQVVDHDPPLVKRYYEGDPVTGEKPGFQVTDVERRASAGDRSRMQVQAQSDSNKQGGKMSQYSKQMKKELGLQ